MSQVSSRLVVFGFGVEKPGLAKNWSTVCGQNWVWNRRTAWNPTQLGRMLPQGHSSDISSHMDTAYVAWSLNLLLQPGTTHTPRGSRRLRHTKKRTTSPYRRYGGLGRASPGRVETGAWRSEPRHLRNFFMKPAVSYGEFKQQCIAVRRWSRTAERDHVEREREREKTYTAVCTPPELGRLLSLNRGLCKSMFIGCITGSC